MTLPWRVAPICWVALLFSATSATATFISTPASVATPQPPPASLPAAQVYAPYAVALIALLGGLLGAFLNALYNLLRGQMDARYAYASEILKFRLRQIEDFYAPAHLYVEQSRVVYKKFMWTLEREKPSIPLEEFRLLDHIYAFQNDSQLKPIIDQILAIGTKLTQLISEQSGLIEGGVNSTFIDYQGHFAILDVASKQDLTSDQKDGWQEFGYYPRLLNREIHEGYKLVLRHLENYANAGDRIIAQLLRQKPVELGKYRRQLLENLRYYESHAKEYADKFDTFNLSNVMDRFVAEIGRTRDPRPSEDAADPAIKILDAGCGTGRDTLAFVEKGYAVTAIDASPAMLRECREKLKAAVDNPRSAAMRAAAVASECVEMTFDEARFRNEFDGVWAAASLLHLPVRQMEEDVPRLIQALKPNGVCFMSFKYGSGEREFDARFYSYLNKAKVRKLLKPIRGAEIVEMWLSDAAGKDLSPRAEGWASILADFGRYERSYWLNILGRKGSA